MELDEKILKSKAKNQEALEKIRYDIKNESNFHFFQAINKKNSIPNVEVRLETEEMLSEADGERDNQCPTLKHEKCYQEKRA